MMKPFVKSPVAFAAVKIGFTALSYLSLKGLYKKNKPMAWVASTAANLLLSYVVSNNVQHDRHGQGPLSKSWTP